MYITLTNIMITVLKIRHFEGRDETHLDIHMTCSRTSIMIFNLINEDLHFFR